MTPCPNCGAPRDRVVIVNGVRCCAVCFASEVRWWLARVELPEVPRRIVVEVVA